MIYCVPSCYITRTNTQDAHIGDEATLIYNRARQVTLMMTLGAASDSM